MGTDNKDESFITAFDIDIQRQCTPGLPIGLQMKVKTELASPPNFPRHHMSEGMGKCFAIGVRALLLDYRQRGPEPFRDAPLDLVAAHLLKATEDVSDELIESKKEYTSKEPLL